MIMCGTQFVHAQVPSLRLRGQIFQASGPVSGHTLRVRFFSNDPIDTTVVTDTLGRYLITKELVNQSSEGLFSFILEDCDRKILTKSRAWSSAEGYDIREDIEICVDTSDDCSVRIVALPNPSGGFNLVAVSQKVLKYNWSTGATTQTINVQSVGTYCVTITDSLNCRASDCFNLNVTDVRTCGVNIQLRFSPNPNEVRLEANGRGSGNYRFKWDTGDTTRTLIVTQPGRYCVFMFDQNLNCSDSACFDVRQIHFGQGKDCSVWFSIQNSGGPMFTLRALNNRPLEQVQYRWSTGETTQTIQVMSPGIYCVTATFQDGCTDEFCGTVVGGQPTQCTVEIQTELIDPIGLWRVTAVSPQGLGFATINWSNGAQTPSTEVLGPGTVCVSVVYSNGCRAKRCIRLTEGTLNVDNPIQTKSQAIGFEVFPNPVVDILSIKIDDGFWQSGFSTNSLVRILSTSGKVLNSSLLMPYQGVYQMNVGILPSGLYLLQLEIDEEIRHFKFFKQ